jgi:beta-glucosidase
MFDRETALSKARALVEKMTLEEKASQLRFHAPAIPRLGVPAYDWWNEALHGVARAGTATVFPQAIARAAAFDLALEHEIAQATAIEGRAKYNAAISQDDHDIYKGLTFFSPNVNIFRDPRWGRGHETFGEDPYLTTEMGCTFIEGMQGEGPVMLTAACAKHFAVHSGPENIRHQFNARCNQKDLWETYLPAFEAAVKRSGVESVMGAYNRTNGEPCCGSKTLLKDILREGWGFEGFTVSDCWALRDFHLNHMVTAGPMESIALAMENGLDLNCGNLYEYLLDAYEGGFVSEEQITLAAERLFTTRYLLGIMGEGSEYDSIPFTKIDSPEYRELSLTSALKSCVLLKNDGLLPLDPSKLQTLTVIGPNANSRLALIGNYHGTAARYITVLEGIEDAVGKDVRVLYAQGCDIKRDRDEVLAEPNDRLAEAVAAAKAGDAVVLVVGLDELLEGEAPDDGNSMDAGDKEDLLLPEPQRALLDAVIAVGKPTVIVLMAGSSIDLEAAGEKANALLLAWYPGAQGGKAVASLLFGEASPSGKLPLTFYYNEDLSHMPDFTDYALTGRTYRYLSREPLYPFGFGLTYGDIRVEAARVLSASAEDGAIVELELCNRGQTATEDVAQLYIRADSPFAPPNPVLCAFGRVALAPDQSTKLTLKIASESLSVVNDEGARIACSHFALYAGLSQPDARSRELTGQAPICLALKLYKNTD